MKQEYGIINKESQSPNNDPNVEEFHPITDTNFPLILTGDQGCGKTHTIIKWLMKFNEPKNDIIDDDDIKGLGDGFSSNSGTSNQGLKTVKNVKKIKPNVNVNGDVVFTYFAGIESINSRVFL